MLFLYLFASFPFFYFIYWFTKPLTTSLKQKPATDYSHIFYDENGRRNAFPSVFDPATVHVSLIAPAYNEEFRLRDMMHDTMNYLTFRQQRDPAFRYEVIIVDDGSSDRTSDIGLEFVRIHGADNVRVLRLTENQGKGGAVQQGVLNSRGAYVLFLDSDGATNISDIERLETEMTNTEKDGHGVVCGSRAHLQADAVAKRKWYRNILMYGFHISVSLLCVQGVKDTQCGFKLFTRKTAQRLFITQHLRRWSFDVELLVIARKLGIPIKECAVNWTEIPGSKLNLIESSILMMRDLMMIRLCYLFGFWRIAPQFMRSDSHNPLVSSSKRY